MAFCTLRRRKWNILFLIARWTLYLVVLWIDFLPPVRYYSLARKTGNLRIGISSVFYTVRIERTVFIFL